MNANPLDPELLRRMNAYWRAANYLSVGQIYLYDNPLLREPLTLSHVKPLVVGHWGTTPGQNFIYVHLNRVIKKYDLDMFYIAGPGHGGPALVGNTYLEGSYTEIYPDISQDEAGMKKLFKQFSFPGGISSHVAPTTPGSIHEGGELGYSLSHAFGAAFDNPGLIVACIIGDGEAETGPLATAWQSNKLLDPITDGAVLPILHLNGYKISNPTVLARIEPDELEQFLRGCGWAPLFVEGDEPEAMHQLMAAAVEQAVVDIRQMQQHARDSKDTTRPRWPMIVLRSPKGWTGPKVVDGLQIEGTFRSHQVPLLVDAGAPGARAAARAVDEELQGRRSCSTRMADSTPSWPSSRPRATAGWARIRTPMAGFCCRICGCRTFARTRCMCRRPAPWMVRTRIVLGRFLRDVATLNQDHRNFRIFGPDETLSNLLGAVFETTDRQWDARVQGNDEFLAPAGRVVDSMLSEHQCEGWLEGYLLTGRHGLFNSYEAFVRIVDSMFSQHAKWLKVTSELPWRRKIASLNYLLASHVWQQDHNGFTHQDPGFLDHVINKKADIVRVYLPPDANCLLSVFDHCLRSRHYVNVVVAGQARPAAVADDGRGDRALHGRHRHLAVGEQRSGRRARRGHGVLRRHADVGDPGRGVDPARASARPQDPRDQRRRSDAAAAQHGAPARPDRYGLRLAVHHRQAHRVRLPWLSVAGPPAHVSSDQSQAPRPRLQGRGHDHHAVRHASAE